MYAAAARIRTESPVSGSALSRILRPPPAPLPAPPPPPPISGGSPVGATAPDSSPSRAALLRATSPHFRVFFAHRLRHFLHRHHRPRFLVVVQLVQQRQIVLLHALRFFARHIRAAHGKNPHRRLFRAFAGFDGHAIFVTRSVTRVT